VNVGAVEHRESAIVPLEGKEQIRAAEKDYFGTSISAQLLSFCEEYASLWHRSPAHDRHLGVVLVHLVERFSFRHHNRGRRYCAIHRVSMTMRVPRIPTIFRFRAPDRRASTSGSAFSSGKGDIASNSRMQK